MRSYSRHEQACPEQRLFAVRRFSSASAIINATEKDFTIPSVPQKVLKARAAVVRRVNSALQGSFGKRYNAELFGSTVYGTDSANSDLDMVLLDSLKPRGPEPGAPIRPYGPYDISAVAAALAQVRSMKNKTFPMFTKIESVPNAMVPIVKFTDSASGLHCDLNVNDRLGVINTALLNRYCILSPLLRPMLYVIKCWARKHGLNEPSATPATPSSFAYALMTISFLQIRGLLPNLQEGYDGLWPDDEHSVWFRRTTRVTKTVTWAKCDARLVACEGWQPTRNIPPIKEALIDWFKYWASEHDYSMAVSVRDGGIIAKKELARRHSPDNPQFANLEDCHEYGFGIKLPAEVTPSKTPELATPAELAGILGPPLCVHDPFLRLKNLTVSVGAKALRRFKKECTAASESLQSGMSVSQLCTTRQRPS